MEKVVKTLTQARPSVNRHVAAVVYPHLRGSIVEVVRKVGEKTPPLTEFEDRKLLREYAESGDFEQAVKHAQLSRGPITLTKDADLQTKRRRARTGSKGMNSRARHTLMAACATLERKCPPESLGFFTATIPDVGAKARHQVHANWERVVKNFIQSLRDESERKGFKLTYAHVTEIQEQRFRTTGFPWLHLHVVFRCRRHRSAPFYVEHPFLREKWTQALNSVCDDEPYGLAVTHITVVEKSVVDYLGKYMSKGCSAVALVVAEGFTEYLPKQWWGCSRRLSVASRALTVRGRDWLAKRIRADIRERAESCFNWLAPIEIEDDGGHKVHVGWVFHAKESYYQELLSMMPAP